MNWTFLRPLLSAVLISLFVLISTIFSLYSYLRASGGLRPWTSFADVHATFGDVFIVDAKLDLTRIEVEWWVAPASTLVFFITTSLGFVFGSDESMFGFRTVRRWYNTRFLGRSMDMDSFVAPSEGFPATISLTSGSSPVPNWNDSLRFSHAPDTVRLKVPKIISDSPPPASDLSSDTDSDASFIVSTLNYVQSSTGRRALGLASQAEEAAPEARGVVKVIEEPETILPPASPNRLSVVDPALHLPDAPASVPDTTILSSSWPEPPSTLPISINLSPLPVPSPSPTGSRRSHPTSPTGSISSSTISMSTYQDGWFLPVSYETRPFEHSGVPTEVVLPPPPRAVRKMRSKDSLHRALHLGRDRPSGKGRRGDALEEGVYMTVVKETV
ncbi:hypothetical protein EIP91_004718 [Steccherinum ochraceum]|uniref:Uncharacterized protein n=1 Tax=Steccherinum ochraceum TaxID=92696 RepID=A0A4R0R895_9APHY|nr:hypothetical protein EIP91_004718 [Steccherinum ochraceum]